jgi:hypothetical protein
MLALTLQPVKKISTPTHYKEYGLFTICFGPEEGMTKTKGGLSG